MDRPPGQNTEVAVSGGSTVFCWLNYWLTDRQTHWLNGCPSKHHWFWFIALSWATGCHLTNNIIGFCLPFAGEDTNWLTNRFSWLLANWLSNNLTSWLSDSITHDDHTAHDNKKHNLRITKEETILNAVLLDQSPWQPHKARHKRE